jgi:hypothetical protein
MDINALGQLKYLEVSEVGVTDGLVGYWKLNGDANDYSGSGNNGAINGAITTSALKGLGYKFNGTTDYIQITQSYTVGKPYTILFWAKPNTVLPNTTSVSSRKTLIVGPGPVWNPGIWVTGLVVRSHCQNEYQDSSINWLDLSWKQIGMVFDGVNCFNIIDGLIVPSVRTAYSPPLLSSQLIGAENLSGSAVNWDGVISDVRNYNRALGTDEILIQYKYGLTNTGMQMSSSGTVYLNNQINEGI